MTGFPARKGVSFKRPSVSVEEREYLDRESGKTVRVRVLVLRLAGGRSAQDLSLKQAEGLISRVQKLLKEVDVMEVLES